MKFLIEESTSLHILIPLGTKYRSQDPVFKYPYVSSTGQPTRSIPPTWGFGVRLKTSRRKKTFAQKHQTGREIFKKRRNINLISNYK